MFVKQPALVKMFSNCLFIAKFQERFMPKLTCAIYLITSKFIPNFLLLRVFDCVK